MGKEGQLRDLIHQDRKAEVVNNRACVQYTTGNKGEPNLVQVMVQFAGWEITGFTAQRLEIPRLDQHTLYIICT
jgi:hypothetical protein